MRKLLCTYVVLTLFLASCTRKTSTEAPSLIAEQPGQSDSSDGGDLSPVEYAVVKQLAGIIGLKINEVTVIENKETEFNDTCLGVTMQDVMCAQVITPGNIIVLEADGMRYEYHTNKDGSKIQPTTLALTWSREGGFAGFCDRMTVYLSGEVYGSQCKSQDGRMATIASLLSVEDRDKFFDWTGQYGKKTLDASDPKGTVDGMSLVIEFFGSGNGKPGKSEQEEIFTWAQELFNELYK